MKTEETLGIIALAALGAYIVIFRSGIAAAATPHLASPAQASAPGAATSTLTTEVNDASGLFGWLTGSGNNASSTNSTAGVSSTGGVASNNSVSNSSAAGDAESLYNLFG